MAVTAFPPLYLIKNLEVDRCGSYNHIFYRLAGLECPYGTNSAGIKFTVVALETIKTKVHCFCRNVEIYKTVTDVSRHTRFYVA